MVRERKRRPRDEPRIKVNGCPTFSLCFFFAVKSRSARLSPIAEAEDGKVTRAILYFAESIHHTPLLPSHTLTLHSYMLLSSLCSLLPLTPNYPPPRSLASRHILQRSIHPPIRHIDHHPIIQPGSPASDTGQPAMLWAKIEYSIRMVTIIQLRRILLTFHSQGNGRPSYCVQENSVYPVSAIVSRRHKNIDPSFTGSSYYALLYVIANGQLRCANASLHCRRKPGQQVGQITEYLIWYVSLGIHQESHTPI